VIFGKWRFVPSAVDGALWECTTRRGRHSWCRLHVCVVREGAQHMANVGTNVVLRLLLCFVGRDSVALGCSRNGLSQGCSRDLPWRRLVVFRRATTLFHRQLLASSTPTQSQPLSPPIMPAQGTLTNGFEGACAMVIPWLMCLSVIAAVAQRGRRSKKNSTPSCLVVDVVEGLSYLEILCVCVRGWWLWLACVRWA
jgi:hypothetical protein